MFLLKFSDTFSLPAIQIDLQRLLNYLLLILSVAGGIVVGMLAGRLLDLSLGGEHLSSADPISRHVQSRSLEEDDFQIILDRNLFNSDAEDAGKISLSSSKIVTKKTAKKAKAVGNLLLVGTITAGKSSLAVVQVGAKVGVFQLNQELAPGVLLGQVEQGSVTVTDHGTDRKLLLKKHKTDNNQRLKNKKATGSKQEIVAVDKNHWKLSKAVVGNARSNLNSLLQTARMVPQLKNGKTIGFKLMELEKGSLLEKIGLRVGDLVVEINQVKLDSPEKALQVFQQVREASNISLGLLRNGKLETFEYSFE